MANSKTNVEVVLGFKANTDQAQKAIRELNNQLNKIQDVNIERLGINTELREAAEAAKILQQNLQAATNVNTGKINFQSTQTQNPVTVSNLFPLTAAPTSSTAFSTETNAQNSFARTIIHVEGETTWANGLDYVVSAVQKNLTVGNSATPLPLKVHVYESTDSNTHAGDLQTGGNDTLVLPFETAANLPSTGKTELASGHIAGTSTYGSGNRYKRDIVVDAYILASDIAITDTPEESTAWVNGRTRYSTEQWNALSTAGGAKFKILVESRETGGSYVANGNYS